LESTKIMTAISPYAPQRPNSMAFFQTNPMKAQAILEAQYRRQRSKRRMKVILLCILLKYWKPANQLLRTLIRFIQKRNTPQLSPKAKDFLTRQIQFIMNKIAASPVLSRIISIMNLCWTKLCSQGRENTSTNHPLALDILLPSTQPTYSHRTKILSILNFWFQHDPNESQKKLWMVSASSNAKLIHDVDQDITRKYESIVYELAMDVSSIRTEWLDGDMYGWEGKLAAIIALDQMSRHMFRYYSKSKKSSSLLVSHHIAQKQLDTTALEVATLFTHSHSQQIKAGTVPFQMYVFALMPYRHANTLESLSYVQQCIQEAESIQSQLDATLLRFRKATSRRLNVLQDEARREGKSTSDSHEDKDISQPDSNTATQRNSDVKKGSKSFSEEDLLEVFPFDADMSTVHNDATMTSIEKFLQNRGIHPIYTSSGSHSTYSNGKHHTKRNVIYPSQKKKIKHPPNRSSKGKNPAFKSQEAIENDPTKPFPLIVSLSGGVDSMVIAAILSNLSFPQNESGRYYNIKVIAVHIDYANRPEAHAEANYVHQFCQKYNVIYRCREIAEVTRGVTARDEYEKISRNVRYDFYKVVMKELCFDWIKEDHESLDYARVPVLLGHHKGDLRENVLSNSMKGCGPLELSGMTEVGKVEGVTIWRPLLILEKSFIYDYAHKYGVPYFKDTTPSWSTRGKLRNKLLPLLQDIYGEGSMTNLSFLASESDAARELLVETTMQPFFNSVKKFGPMGIVFESNPWKTQSYFFWKFVMKDLLHSVGRGMFSDKSAMSFLERIQMDSVRAGWLQCRKDYAVFLASNGRVFVFHPESFPWAKKDQYKVAGTTVPINSALRVGPWTIQTEKINNISKKDADALLEKKAILNMEYFMKGSFFYYIKCPKKLPSDETEDILTIISEYSRGSRPLAWRGVDLKIQSTLPLVGNSKASLDALNKDSSFRNAQIVKIIFQRDGMQTVRNDVDKRNSEKTKRELSSNAENQQNFWDGLIQPFVANKGNENNRD